MTGMRLKRLEMLLSKVKGFPLPSAKHEQYLTPPDLAARLLFHAHMRGDIGGRRVCDLGCGTGILAIGAALLGATEVVGVELDSRALQIAFENGKELGLFPRFIQARLPHPDLVSLVGPCDTVVMNPPFGAQDAHADRPFIDAALAIAPAVYGIFNAGSRNFVKAYAGETAEVEEVVEGTLLMKRTFSFHAKDLRETPVEVIVLRRRMV